MHIISFREVIELNKELEEKELEYKIHLRDTCGNQAFWIERLGAFPTVDQEKELYLSLDEFFLQRRLSIEYSEDKMNFWIVKGKA